MKFNPSTYLLSKIQVGVQIFSGIKCSRLFVQIATFQNEVIYESESTVKGLEPKNLLEMIEDIFPIDFYKMEIKISKKNFRFYDGEKIKIDGERKIERCSSVKDSFPGFAPDLFPIWE